MKTIYDVQQILRRFGTFIYTGDRLGDLELMAFEIDELKEMEFINNKEYQYSKLIIRQETRRLRNEKGET